MTTVSAPAGAPVSPNPAGTPVKPGKTPDGPANWAGRTVATVDASFYKDGFFFRRNYNVTEPNALVGKSVKDWENLFHPVAGKGVTLSDAVRAAAAVVRGGEHGATGDVAVMQANNGRFWVGQLFDGVTPYRYNGGTYYTPARQFTVDKDFTNVTTWTFAKQHPHLAAIVGSSKFIDLSAAKIGEPVGAANRQAVPEEN